MIEFLCSRRFVVNIRVGVLMIPMLYRFDDAIEILLCNFAPMSKCKCAEMLQGRDDSPDT